MKLPADVPRRLPNCGVVALSIALNKPYKEVEMFWKIRRNGNWKGRTSLLEIIEFLKINGHSTQGFRTPIERVNLRKAFQKNYFKKDSTYMVWTTRHLQVVKGGKVIDQNVEEAVHYSEFWGAGKRVQFILEVKG